MAATALVGQAPINLGPLTTTFTPPPACATAVGSIDGGFLGIGKSTQNFAFLGQSCSKDEAIDATSCWPPVSQGAVTKSAALEGWGFYSPGVHCPVGHVTACSAVGGKGNPGWDMQFKLGDRETAVGCCPSGYGCTNINGQTCLMVATSTTVSTVTCDGSESADFAFQTVPDSEADITAFSLFAPMIQINWQSSDRKYDTKPTKTDTNASPTGTPTSPKETDDSTNSLNSNPIHNGASPTGSDTIAPDYESSSPDSAAVSATDSAASESSTPESSGMATSTKVGLGVAGGAVVAVGIIFGIFWLWRRKKIRQEEAEMDRLYGMKHTTGSSADLATNPDEIPGWYRGQRPFSPVTPTIRVDSPYQGGFGGDMGGGGGSGGGLTAPPSPYYRPYRP